jgi:hypothetical protein
MSDASVVWQVLFGQLKGARPVGSSPVALRSVMHKEVLLLHGGRGKCIDGTGINVGENTSVDSML